MTEQNQIQSLLIEKHKLQVQLDNMTSALELMVQQYNEAMALLEVSTSALESLTTSITESLMENAQ